MADDGAGHEDSERAPSPRDSNDSIAPTQTSTTAATARSRVEALQSNRRLTTTGAGAAHEARRLREAQEQREVQVNSLREHIKTLQAKLQAETEVNQKLEDENTELKETLKLQQSELDEAKQAAARRAEQVEDAAKRAQSNDEDFDMLSEALAEKEQESRVRAMRIVELEETLERMQSEDVRLRTMLRKGTNASAAIDLKPKTSTEDVCLSARSFAENELVALRDEALNIKEKQLALLNSSNVALRENIDHLETEMQRMQVDLIAKDKMLNSMRESKDAAESRIEELLHKIEVKKGREAAMEVATQQNAQLLLLLQQHEASNEELQSQNESLEEELQTAKEKVKNVVRQNADHEANVTTMSAEVSRLKRELLTMRSSWEKEETLLRRKLKKLEAESSKTISVQRDELRDRREKHYQMLERMQIAEDKVRAAEDKVDLMNKEMDEFDEERQELQARVAEIRRWADSREAQHREALLDAHNQRDEARKYASEMEKQRAALTLQLHEMSGTVLKAVDKQKGAIEEVSQAKSELTDKEIEIQHLQKQMIREGNLQGKRRMKAELEQRTLASQLDLLRRENMALAEATNATYEDQASRSDALAKRCLNLEAQIEEATSALEARLHGIMTYVEAAVLVRGNNGYQFSLRGCRIGSTRTIDPITANKVVMQVCKHLAGLLSRCKAANDASVTLDLANNALSDEHVPEALGILVQAPFIASSITLNLCENEISPAGLRLLVLALQKNPRVQHVFVHRDGTIQGLRGSEVVYTLEVASNKQRPEDSWTQPAAVLTQDTIPSPRTLPRLPSR